MFALHEQEGIFRNRSITIKYSPSSLIEETEGAYYQTKGNLLYYRIFLYKFYNFGNILRRSFARVDVTDNPLLVNKD